MRRPANDAIAVVVDFCVFRSPDQVDWKIGGNAKAHGGAQTLRPTGNGAERSSRPILGADERGHFAAADQEVGVIALADGSPSHIFSVTSSKLRSIGAKVGARSQVGANFKAKKESCSRRRPSRSCPRVNIRVCNLSAKKVPAQTSSTIYQPVSDAGWPPEISDLRRGFAGRLNVYRVMAHNPPLLRSWVAYRDYVVTNSSLGPQRSEVAILRTGHRLDAAYEWSHHVVRARACGMDDARILSLRGDPDLMAPEDQVITRAVDDLIDRACLSEPARDALAALVGPQGVFDVIATVGLYTTLAYIVKSFATPLDAEVAADLAANPIG